MTKLITAVDYLKHGVSVIGERAKQYDTHCEQELSFPQVAQAFTALTGRQLSGSDVCLILNLVKKVRQYAQPNRLHQDSLIDSVNYDALWAQELTSELDNKDDTALASVTEPVGPQNVVFKGSKDDRS